MHIANSSQTDISSSFKLGLENVSDDFLCSLTDRRDLSYSVGLITNQTGTDRSGNRNIDLLLKRGLHVKVIFAPQHGFHGDIVTNGTLKDGVDNKTQIPIINLHNHHDVTKMIPKNIPDIDVLIFDLQDAGMRYYSYVATLVTFLDFAAQHNKVFVVLDRPNLLGSCVEGIISEKSNRSSLLVPIRHGMTVGELAGYCNIHVVKKPAKLHVVPMMNYDRTNRVYKFLMAHLSPNITSLNSCYGYSFLGLLGEVAPFDIGVGTDKAFQCILLPESIQFQKQKWCELRSLLEEQGIESTFYRYFSKRKKQYCSGLRLFIHDINTFSSFNTLLVVLDFFGHAGISLSFSSSFDSAIGTSKVRECLEGKISKKELKAVTNDGLYCFYNKAFSSFMYKPFPKIVTIS